MDQFEDETKFDIDVKSSLLKLILEWLEKHRNEEPKSPPQPLRNYDLSEVVGKWEDEYMNRVYNKSYDGLFEFLNSVNYLNIPELLELGSAKAACLLKDFSPEEFKKLFKIEENCSDDDLKKLEEEVLKEREEERQKEKARLEEEEKNKELEEKK